LFKSLSKAVRDYTSGAFEGFDKEDVKGLLKDRLITGKENLDAALESVKALCEPVRPPKDTLAYVEYFCGNPENPEELRANEQKRISLYTLTSRLLRCYANLANEMKEAGYSQKEAEEIRTEVGYFENVRSEVKLASGDYIDLKKYEPAMRHLIDSYIDAKESKKVSAFDNLTIIDLIIKKGVDAVDSFPDSIKKSESAAAEVIENNVRRLIIEEKPTNPKYFEKMSVLLDELIRERKQNAIQYAKYLKRIVELVKNVKNITVAGTYPKAIDTKAKRALYDNLDSDEKLALKVHENVEAAKPDDWRGSRIKERQVRIAIKRALSEFGINDENKVNAIFELVKNQHEY
jgi:type I restriction enzyme R subunit